MKLNLIKTKTGLIPNDPESDERYCKIKLGAVVQTETKTYRNYGFHKKYFALLNFGFEYWKPGEISSKHGIPEKNFEQFREDITILAGYYTTVIRLDGSVRILAKSIAFGSMEQDEFEKLYNSVINVILNKIFKGMEEKELTDLINKTLEFI